MTQPSSGESGHRFQVTVGKETIDLALDGDHVTIDGRTVAFSCVRLSERRVSLLIDGRSYAAVVTDEADGITTVQIGNQRVEMRLKNERDMLLERFGLAGAAQATIREVRAPMPGLVLSVAVEVGQEVSSGTGLVVLEAMKMENEIRAERDGVVMAVHVAPGDAVGKNELLLDIE